MLLTFLWATAQALLFAVAILILVLLAFIFIPAPREYRKYRQSSYYRKYGRKYKVGITRERSFPVIEYLLNEGVPYDDFIMGDDADMLVMGNVCYLFPWFEEIRFEDNGDCLISIQDDDAFEPLAEEDVIKNTLGAKVIINSKEYPNLDVEKAKSNDLLVVYEELSDLKELLKK